MEKCSHATVNRTDVPLDGRTRLWVATVHDRSHTIRENCPLTTAPDDKRKTSGDDWPREQVGTSRRLTTVPVGRQTVSRRHCIGCRRRPTTSNDTAWRRTSDFAPDGWRQATTWHPEDEWRTARNDWWRRGSQPKTANDSRSTTPCIDTADGGERLSTHTTADRRTTAQLDTADSVPRLSSLRRLRTSTHSCSRLTT